MLIRALLLLALAVSGAGGQFSDTREALRLGRTRDDALYESFSKGYNLTPAPPVSSAEVVTEFRRAVMLVRERAQLGEFGFTEHDLELAMKPHLGQITLIVVVNLHPLNTYQKAPAYDIYVNTGPDTPPVAAPIRRDAQYAIGGSGNAPIAIRLEATLPSERIAAARAPELIVTDDHADVIWRAHLDLKRFR